MVSKLTFAFLTSERQISGVIKISSIFCNVDVNVDFSRSQNIFGKVLCRYCVQQLKKYFLWAGTPSDHVLF